MPANIFPGLPRRIISLACLTAMLILVFSMSLPVQADAASDFKVKQWSDASGDAYYYYLYKGSLPKYYEPTFIRFESDNYYSDNGKIRIAIYSPYGNPTEEEADAFYKYLLSKSTAKACEAGWYGITYSNYTTRHVYKIEGWNKDRPLSYLLDAGPFRNSRNERLELIEISNGDTVSENWQYLHSTLKCTTVVYFAVKNPRDGATVGFKFYDEYGEVNQSSYS